MVKNYGIFIFIISACCITSCYEETKVLVNATFQATVENNNHTAPVSVVIQNNTTGADFYQWSFEGGNPSFSKEQYPGTVVYEKSGTYIIILEAWNNNERNTHEFTFSVDSAVVIDFDAEILINDFAPAEVKLTNHTAGAVSFYWTFEDGSPMSSDKQFPENVLFDDPGEHTISLTVNNGRENFTTSRTITLQPKIEVSFDIEPNFDDYDYEVPFTAALINKSANGLTYEWTSTGGFIRDESNEDTEITFTEPGIYQITLTGDNKKENKTYSKEIILKENSNLYILKDIKFGIKNAENTLGCFFSLKERRLLAPSEVDVETGKSVNLVFFGLDASFSRSYFLSPDEAVFSGFASIPGAAKTHFINDLSKVAINFTDADFAAMTNDSSLRLLKIKESSNNTTWFTNVFIPRLVLFETNEGIKGVIRIKAFVSEGNSSYVLTDIKVQKEAVK